MLLISLNSEYVPTARGLDQHQWGYEHKHETEWWLQMGQTQGLLRDLLATLKEFKRSKDLKKKIEQMIKSHKANNNFRGMFNVGKKQRTRKYTV